MTDCTDTKQGYLLQSIKLTGSILVKDITNREFITDMITKVKILSQVLKQER